MLKLSTLQLVCSIEDLFLIHSGKTMINTINAHSYNTAQKDVEYAESLVGSDYLLPDGVSIVKACRWLNAKSQPKMRITGWDLFLAEMEMLNAKGGKCFFMGSSKQVLAKIKERAAKEYPNITVEVYSPPYKSEFTDEDNKAIITAINAAHPDLVWIGMTAPKQEKWAYIHWQELDIHCHVGSIGAVFDFYAGTVKRAPIWMQKNSMEWLYRLVKEPRRMWRRYLIGNIVFFWNIIKERYGK